MVLTVSLHAKNVDAPSLGKGLKDLACVPVG